MSVTRRPYRHPEDYEAVGEFLVRSYAKTHAGPHRSWLQPRWEYMCYHPLLWERDLVSKLDRCGLWEDDGALVAAAHFEMRMGVVYVQLLPEHGLLWDEILEYAETHLAGSFDVGTAVLVYIDDDDREAHAIAVRRGFERMDAIHAESISLLTAAELPSELPAPEGFEILGLDEDDDLRKVHRVMHRGFDHDGEPPEDELDARRRKLSAPNLRKDLTVVARAPDGDFVSFCGMWLDAVNRVAYVEPVATDPDYRRRGLGMAVVLEGCRRCFVEGATVAHVGSTLPFYLSIGFRPTHRQTLWRKVLAGAASATGPSESAGGIT
ncbi:MAG: GNAT family N-acetyltransferase [Candidatus Bipolaricaulota bacterium]|nr:MAG: GNAT family N-acetyltransferase [Candidatus Bipolaricaulota bacterium]